MQSTLNNSSYKSVHLESFPQTESLPLDLQLNQEMDFIKDICNAALSLRKEIGIKVRMPLAKLTIYTKNNFQLNDISLLNVLKDEINVKEVIFNSNFSEVAQEKVIFDFKKLGIRIGHVCKELNSMMQENKFSVTQQKQLTYNNITIYPDEYSTSLTIKEGVPGKTCLDKAAIIILDTTITPELEIEGFARDIVRFLQNSRKEMNLNITDRIKVLLYHSDDKVSYYLKSTQIQDYIKSQTLTTDLKIEKIYAEAMNQQKGEEYQAQRFTEKINNEYNISIFIAINNN